MIYLDKLDEVREIIRNLGRDVTIIAATKTQSKEIVDEFHALAPDVILGENRVQELVDKFDERYEWHFIGQLQTNKVKYIADKVSLIHSLDRDDLAKEIEKQGAKRDIIIPCLVEINMGAEITKGGVAPEKATEFIRSLEKYPHIRVEGIMSVLPNLGDTPELDGLYSRLDDLYDEVSEIKQSNVDIKYLSAGMSGDYKVALRHKSNMIRLGRVLFGERNYNI